MTKVITYGTYDLLHYGHIRLLERAKSLGDYLIVGVTADDFDKTRGKINVQQSLMERVEAIRSTGIADEIIIEEYEGQKIDDIRKYDVDIFTVGSDWCGRFDYLKEYCKVIYLDRTQGISSTEIREKKGYVFLGLIGDSEFINKFVNECNYVNGINIVGICTNNQSIMSKQIHELSIVTDSVDNLLEHVDAVYIRSLPQHHYQNIKKALDLGKHVLCESPITLETKQYEELLCLAKSKGIVLMEAIKTAYATAYMRLLLLLKGGKIGKIVSIDATCTSLCNNNHAFEWKGIHEWGPTALLPVFQILGIEYRSCDITTMFESETSETDIFTRISFVYEHAVATVKVGSGVKSEGELIISGTNGYVYVPAPWWKTDYFEIRFENQNENKRYFYQLDGEGIRYEIAAFVKAISGGHSYDYIDSNVTKAISGVMEKFQYKDDVRMI